VLQQERVTLPFLPNRRRLTVAWDDYRLVWQRQHCVVQRAQNLLHRAAGKVGAADRAGEERVAGDQFLLRREIQANTAFGVARRVQNAGGLRSGGDGFSRGYAAVNFYFSRRGHADPRGLHVEHFEQCVVVLVEENRRAGYGAELHRSTNVVDVGVRDNDLLDLQIVFAEQSEDFIDIVAGVDHHGFARSLVADDGAVALQWADGKNFVDHEDIVASKEASQARDYCVAQNATLGAARPGPSRATAARSG